MLVTQRSGKVRREFMEDANGSLTPLPPAKTRSSSSSAFSSSFLYAFFQAVFLPQGFPESVSSDYVTYQVTMGQINQEPRCKYWATHSSAHSFARTAHSLACSALFTSLARCAHFARTTHLAHSLARGTVND